jgi:hypothetical protein
MGEIRGCMKLICHYAIALPLTFQFQVSDFKIDRWLAFGGL